MSNSKELDQINELLSTFSEMSDTEVNLIPEEFGGQTLLVDVALGYANYEWNNDRKNYRNDDHPDLNKVLEHASRRGDNIEAVVTIRLHLGHVSAHPEMLEKAKRVVEERVAKVSKANELRLQAQLLLEEADRL